MFTNNFALSREHSYHQSPPRGWGGYGSTDYTRDQRTGSNGLKCRRRRPDTLAACGAPLFLRSWTVGARNIYVAYFRPCIAFTDIPLLVLYHLWGAKPLTCLQVELGCGLLNLAAFQALEVAGEHLVYVSIFLGPQIATPRASWRERVLPRLSFPVQLPGPLHRWWGRSSGSCSGMQVCSAEEPWREIGHPQWHHFG